MPGCTDVCGRLMIGTADVNRNAKDGSQVSKRKTLDPHRLWAIVQIAAVPFIASQPYHGWIAWWRGEIDPSGGKIV